MNPTPNLSTEAVSARLLAEHQAAQRRQLIGEMVDKFRRDNPRATQAEVDGYVNELGEQMQRLPMPPEIKA